MFLLANEDGNILTFIFSKNLHSSSSVNRTFCEQNILSNVVQSLKHQFIQIQRKTRFGQFSGAKILNFHTLHDLHPTTWRRGN